MNVMHEGAKYRKEEKKYFNKAVCSASIIVQWILKEVKLILRLLYYEGKMKNERQ